MTDRTVVLTEGAQEQLRDANTELGKLVQWYGEDHPIVAKAYRSFAVSLTSLLGMGGRMARAYDYDGFITDTDIGIVVGMVKHRAGYPDGLDDWAKENAPEPFTWSLHS